MSPHLDASSRIKLAVQAFVVAGLVGGTLALPRLGLAADTFSADGRGKTTFSADLDGDGKDDGGRFELAVRLDDQGISGTFDWRPLPTAEQSIFPLREVAAIVESSSQWSDQTAGYQGTASVTRRSGNVIEDVPFEVTVTFGGPDDEAAVEDVTLTGIFDGRPGDETPDDGDYDLPEQTLVRGEILTDMPPPSPEPSSTEPSPTASGSPSPRPTESASPRPTSSPHPTPSQTSYPAFAQPPTSPPATPAVPSGPAADIPFTVGGSHNTARLAAILSKLQDVGISLEQGFLDVVGPFPVAGLSWWTNDWHAYRCCPYPHLHEGLDMFAARGTPVVASADGFISQRVNDPSTSGLGLEVTDERGTQYFYAHLDSFAAGIEQGDRVAVGQVIGYVGNSGNAINTSTHLHFEVQPGGSPVPPMPYVDRWLREAERKAVALVEELTGEPFSGVPADVQFYLTRILRLAAEGVAPEGTGSEGAIAPAAGADGGVLGSPVDARVALLAAAALLLMVLIGAATARPATASAPVGPSALPDEARRERREAAAVPAAADMEVHSEQDERPQEDGQGRREVLGDGVDAGEVVVGAGEEHADQQVDDEQHRAKQPHLPLLLRRPRWARSRQGR